MDINGLEPKNTKGMCFRNNIWYWFPLWDYIWNELDVLTQEEYEGGRFNDGFIISKEKAKAIAKKLNQLIATGEIENYIEQRRKLIDRLPDEVCEYCQGTGKREPNDPSDPGTCAVCGGTGKTRPFIANFHMSIKNMKHFAEFCEYSGGFEIW